MTHQHNALRTSKRQLSSNHAGRPQIQNNTSRLSDLRRLRFFAFPDHKIQWRTEKANTFTAAGPCGIFTRFPFTRFSSALMYIFSFYLHNHVLRSLHNYANTISTQCQLTCRYTVLIIALTKWRRIVRIKSTRLGRGFDYIQ